MGGYICVDFSLHEGSLTKKKNKSGIMQMQKAPE